MDEVDCVHIFYVLKICKIFRMSFFTGVISIDFFKSVLRLLVSSAREKWEMWGNEQLVLHSNAIHDLVIYW